LTMGVEEEERRMRRLRAQVADHNIYRWAGQLLSAIGKMVPEPSTLSSDVPRADDDSAIVPRAELLSAVRVATG